MGNGGQPWEECGRSGGLVNLEQILDGYGLSEPTWRARPSVPIFAPDMDRVWGVPVSPNVWTEFAWSGWVAIFCPSSDLAGHPHIWDGYGGSGCRCSYDSLHGTTAASDAPFAARPFPLGPFATQLVTLPYGCAPRGALRLPVNPLVVEVDAIRRGAVVTGQDQGRRGGAGPGTQDLVVAAHMGPCTWGNFGRLH